MWTFNTDFNKWVTVEDKISKNNFDYLKQELASTRFYSKCLSGATYLPINNLENIYDILGEYEPRDWYISNVGSVYTSGAIPTNSKFRSPITALTSYDFYEKYVSEYGLTLKNLFTPDRLIKDSVKNFIYVDLATTTQFLNLGATFNELFVDGVRVLDGHRILVKDQISTTALPFDRDPNTYFRGNYTLVQDYGATIEYNFYNSDNGIYTFNKGKLFKTTELSDYADCIRYSVSVKLGNINAEKQFHLSRLLNGYYPTTSLNEPIEFKEKQNWLLRNRVDYNNLFEINYYDVVKYATQSYYFNGVTYSIPERTIGIGEFGIILNTQAGLSNIIPNKYKVNLRSISQTEKYYWICGDNGLLLKVRKHDFTIEKIETNVTTNLRSVSFYNDLKGVIVGDLNTILIINDGLTCNKIIVDDFDSYYYNKVIFYSSSNIYIVGNSGVFLELKEDIQGWDVYKRRVSRFIDDFEEYLLVDNINDMYITKTSNWGLSFSYSTQSCLPDKEILLLTTAESKVVVYDINSSIPNFDFIYLDFSEDYGDIKSITRFEGTGTSSNIFYFSWLKTNGESGISSFNLDSFQYVGVDNIYSNTISNPQNAQPESNLYVNKIFNYNATELVVCGNSSLLLKTDYNTFVFNTLDPTLDSRLKSKMLFLDYDIAGKLNFFTDLGDYRLPNEAIFYLSSTFSNFLVTSTPATSIMSNTVTTDTITVANNKPIPLNIEVNLNLNTTSINKLRVNLKSPSGKVINLKRNNSGTGLTFSNTKFSTSTNYTNFTSTPDISYNNKTYQMDKILGIGQTGWISNTNILSDLFLNSSINGNWTLYIDVVEPRVRSFDPFGRFGAPVDEPIDETRSTPVGTFSNWGVNFIYQDSNIVSLTSSVSNLWFDPLIYGATAPSFMTQSETNWLTYWKDTEKTFRYYAGGTYSPLDESTKVLISTTFSYSAVSGSFSVSSDDVTNSITQLERLAPPSIDFEQSEFNGLNLTAITYPTSLSTIYLKDSIMIIRVPTRYPVRVGDVIRLESDVVDGNFVVNRIETLSIPFNLPQSETERQIPSNRTFNYLYMFTNFNENIITNLTKTSSPINIINLNKYRTVTELQNNFNLHPISNGYNLNYTPPSSDSNTPSNITINAKFNNLTSYYNLATNVFVNDNIRLGTNSVIATMSYTGGFLKFGYTPTYNLLDYLEQLNDNTNPTPKFYANKEYLAMPDYRSIPMDNGLGQQTSQVYVEWNSVITPNRVYFGKDLRLEWESIFINTFVDITIYSSGNPPKDSERLLVMKKGIINDPKNFENAGYFIDFHKSLNYVIGVPQTMIDIKSRRTLLQISNDLQELNNIQRGLLKKKNLLLGSEFYNYERDLNFKIPTDSYAKILLSDVDTIRELSALIYIDYKNELAMNITRLDKEYTIPIIDTTNYSVNGKALIICKDDHDLKTGDSVTLEFNGGTFSSQFLNQQYFGYQNVTVVDSTKFYIDLPYGNITYGDTGFVKYIKRDPFLNYQPIDIIDVGVDKRGKNAIELSIDNLSLSGEIYSLVNVDFNKFRFRLVDGLTVETLSLNYPWILEAEITDAIIGTDGNSIVWYKGNWECGRWFGGTWISGIWKSGDWYGGTWNAKKIKDNLISVEVATNTSDKSLSTWFSGRWYDGTWNDGVWVDGRWYGGTWNTGDWYKGTWNDGTWNDGEFSGGIWITGTWNDGILNCNNDPTFWINGKWSGGDFENGMWYNGIFEEKNGLSRFGTKAFNSRTAIWHGGQWLSGSFYSRMILDNNDEPQVSLSHKYSIWYTGNWYSGDVYGGIFYNIDFKSGVWYGGISEEIQIIKIKVSQDNSYLTLNGVFRFNIGDEITIVPKEPQLSSSGLFYSSYFRRERYKILYAENPDLDNKTTRIYFDSDIINNTNYDDDSYTQNIDGVETKMRVISRFRNADWRSGIWTNGIFETGYWQGGIWYDGTFGEKAKWS
jgi:hypothetical protein